MRIVTGRASSVIKPCAKKERQFTTKIGRIRCAPDRHKLGTVFERTRATRRRMLHSSRRSFVRRVAWLPALLVPGVAQATLLRGLNLRDLTLRSQHVLLLTPLASHCRSVTLGGRQVIVTDTSARVDDVIERAQPSSATVIVRTPGWDLQWRWAARSRSGRAVDRRRVRRLPHAEQRRKPVGHRHGARPFPAGKRRQRVVT